MTDPQTVEHCDWREFLTVADDAPPEFLYALDTYFKPFAKVGSDCPGCGARVFGKDFIDLLATFEWGIVHGHGHCRACGWPAVAYHFINDAAGEEILALRNVGLVAHPDFVTKRSDEGAA